MRSALRRPSKGEVCIQSSGWHYRVIISDIIKNSRCLNPQVLQITVNSKLTVIAVCRDVRQRH